jgi:lauroyl/myristoyl acyltransferase
MPIDLQRLSDSRFLLDLVSALARALPPRLGYAFTDLVAARLARRPDSALIRAVRANQWVIRGETLDTEALDHAVLETLRNSARAIFDLYHYQRDPRAQERLIVLDSVSRALTQRPEFDQRGLMVVGLHMRGFDLVSRWLIQQGMKPLVLNLPNPKGGRRQEFEARRRIGMNLVPASFAALRLALRHLERGGIVVTGIDRPVPAPRVHPRFFGRPAALPVHHIALAVKARVPVMIMVPNFQSDGKYHVLTSRPIEMESHPDRATEETRNAERVLGAAEPFFRNAPQQWTMSLPVWPQLVDGVPRGTTAIDRTGRQRPGKSIRGENP